MTKTERTITKDNMKVVARQANSHDCIICGIDNPYGVKAPFYNMEDGSVVSIFKYSFNHQSYPERTHGGMITCMLDEIIGRSIWTIEPDTWGVTIDLNVKFRKPVPYEEELMAIGKVTQNSSKAFVGEGKICKMDGTVLATAKATYLKLPLDKIANISHDDVNVIFPCDRLEIDIKWGI